MHTDKAPAQATISIANYQDLPSAGEPAYMTGAPVEGTRFYIRNMGVTVERQGTAWVPVREMES